MPREGKSYPIDEEWRSRVLEAIAQPGRSKAWLARESGAPKSLVTELLNGARNATTYLPDIHTALGWDPPQPPLPSKDAGEIGYLWDRLDERGRERLIQRGREELDRLLKSSPEIASAKPPTAKKKS